MPPNCKNPRFTMNSRPSFAGSYVYPRDFKFLKGFESIPVHTFRSCLFVCDTPDIPLEEPALIKTSEVLESMPVLGTVFSANYSALLHVEPAGPGLVVREPPSGVPERFVFCVEIGPKAFFDLGSIPDETFPPLGDGESYYQVIIGCPGQPPTRGRIRKEFNLRR